MYGAILGDIIGSPYEFDRGRKKRTSNSLTEEQDSLMTA